MVADPWESGETGKLKRPVTLFLLIFISPWFCNSRFAHFLEQKVHCLAHLRPKNDDKTAFFPAKRQWLRPRPSIFPKREPDCSSTTRNIPTLEEVRANFWAIEVHLFDLLVSTYGMYGTILKNRLKNDRTMSYNPTIL